MSSTTDTKPDTGKPSGENPDQRKKGGFEKKQQTTSYRPTTKFKGRCTELKGFIYDHDEHKHADQFISTTKEVQNYVGRTYKNAGDITASTGNLALPVITEPEERDDPDDRVEMKKWERNYERYFKRQKDPEEHVMTLYNLVWSQCSDSMQQKLESMNTYQAIYQANDGIALLLAIKNTTYDYQSQKYRVESIMDAQYRLLTLGQNNLTTQQYYEQFVNALSVYVHCGGSTQPDPGVLEYAAQKGGWVAAASTNAQKAMAREMMWANWFILHSDRNRFGDLITGLQNNYLMGQDNYPKTLTDAYSRLVNWKLPTSNNRNGNTGAGVSFNTIGEKGKSKAHITCHSCGEKGHYSFECPHCQNCQNPNQAGATVNATTGEQTPTSNEGECTNDNTTPYHSYHFLCHYNILITTKSSIIIPKTWILLDNQSTIDVFANQELLIDIHKIDVTMNIHCNAGTRQTSEIGTYPGYGDVWYHPTGIANILSLSQVRKKGHRVRYDDLKNIFVITRNDGTREHVFSQSPEGLYYLDTAAEKSGNLFVNTVKENKENFTKRDFLRATSARQLLRKIGHPSQQSFLRILDQNLIPNCPVTRRDAMNAEIIFGPDVGSLKGKTVRRTGDPVELIRNNIPPEIMSRYMNVTLTGDIFYGNKNTFFATKSRNIQFCTVEEIPNRKPETVALALTNVRNVYAKRGFKMVDILMDIEFEPLRGDIMRVGIGLNTAATAEHVPEIERHIRTLKERTRSIYNTLPFTKLPDRLIIEMVYASNFWINCFPPNNGVSEVLSPRAIITGSTIDFRHHCQLEFGAYVQTHEEHDNTMASRTVGAIALRPTGNAQGGYFFFSLASGRVVNRNRWTSLPMPNDVINRIHVMARRNPRGLAFSDRYRAPYILDEDYIDGDDDDSTYHVDGESDADESDNDEDNESQPDDNDHDVDDGIYDNNVADGNPIINEAEILDEVYLDEDVVDEA